MLKPNSIVTTNLIKARELIANENNWCTHSYRIGDKRCAVGVLIQEDGSLDLSSVYLLSEACTDLFSCYYNCQNITRVNDTLGHAAVMRMYDRAIELSLQEG